MNLSRKASLNINRRQISSDKKQNLSLCLILFFPFRCCFASSLQFSSLTVKQRKLFHSNFWDVFHFFYKKNSSRKTFLVDCLRSAAAWSTAKLQGPIKGRNFGEKLTHQDLWFLIKPIIFRTWKNIVRDSQYWTYHFFDVWKLSSL